MKPHNYALLAKTILFRMLLYAVVFGLFAFWVPLKQLALGEPAQWEEPLERAKPFIAITVVFSILFGYRDYHKKRVPDENQESDEQVLS